MRAASTFGFGRMLVFVWIGPVVWFQLLDLGIVRFSSLLRAWRVGETLGRAALVGWAAVHLLAAWVILFRRDLLGIGPGTRVEPGPVSSTCTRIIVVTVTRIFVVAAALCGVAAIWAGIHQG